MTSVYISRLWKFHKKFLWHTKSWQLSCKSSSIHSRCRKVRVAWLINLYLFYHIFSSFTSVQTHPASLENLKRPVLKIWWACWKVYGDPQKCCRIIRCPPRTLNQKCQFFFDFLISLEFITDCLVSSGLNTLPATTLLVSTPRNILLYPRHLCRGVYSFRLDVCPLFRSYVRSFVSSFVCSFVRYFPSRS